MKINIYGMGYVGCVSAACLANSGHSVTGVDIDPLKVSIINEGRSPIIEPGLDRAIQAAVSAGRLRAANVGMAEADVSTICVGTPSHENGSLNLDFVHRVTEQIAEDFRENPGFHVVNIRSTVLPGTIERAVIPILEARSQKRVGSDFGVCMNPEFMREGTSLEDFHNPPFTVVGETDTRSGDIIAKLYEDVNAPLIRTSIRVAEMLKYTCNAFHALKVSFANEIGNLCRRLDIDSHELMDVFCQDVKLNLSPYYLKPGFAFGGSCLPKDLRAMLYQVREVDLESPVLSSILRSNQYQIDLAYKLIEKAGKKNVGVLGLSFKPGSDDLRDSPMIELVEKLIGKGYRVSLYDKEVSLAKLFGSNKRYIDSTIPHISCLMKQSVEELIEKSEVLVLGKNSIDFEGEISSLNGEKVIIDLVRLVNNPETIDRYEGICW